MTRAVWVGFFLLAAVCTAGPELRLEDLPAADEVPADFQSRGSLFAYGDIHADPDALLSISSQTGVIDSNGDWAGGKSDAVFVGDLIGRGPNSRFVLDFLNRLKLQAEAAGGRVHLLLGNHELLALTGRSKASRADFAHYVDFVPDVTLDPIIRDLEAVRDRAKIEEVRNKWFTTIGQDGQHRAFATPFSSYAREMMTRNAIIKVGDTLFVHAAADSWLQNRNMDYVARINASIRRFLKETLEFQGGFRTMRPSEPWAVGREGPLWSLRFRDGIDDKTVAQMIAATGAKRVVVGHDITPSRAIERAADGRVWKIDTGISIAHGGRLTALEFSPGTDEPRIHESPRPRGAHPVRLKLEPLFAKSRKPSEIERLDFYALADRSRRAAVICSEGLADLVENSRGEPVYGFAENIGSEGLKSLR